MENKVVQALIPPSVKPDILRELRESWTTPLGVASVRSSKTVAVLLLQHGARTHFVNLIGETILHRAARRVWLDLVRELLNKGAEVNAVTNDGETALFDAAACTSIECLSISLKYGARVDLSNGFKETALPKAARRGRE